MYSRLLANFLGRNECGREHVLSIAEQPTHHLLVLNVALLAEKEVNIDSMKD